MQLSISTKKCKNFQLQRPRSDSQRSFEAAAAEADDGCRSDGGKVARHRRHQHRGFPEGCLRASCAA